MSTWSKSALKLPSVVVSDKAFPTLSSAPPPSKKPVLSFAQKLKETVEVETAATAAAEARKKAESERASAQRLAEQRKAPTSNFYKTHHTTDADYYHEDSSPDEMDYETALEYAEHLRFNRRARVADYSKDLTSSDDDHGEHDGSV